MKGIIAIFRLFISSTVVSCDKTVGNESRFSARDMLETPNSNNSIQAPIQAIQRCFTAALTA